MLHFGVSGPDPLFAAPHEFHVLIEEHLTLRLVRLESPEEWSAKREGLVFLFFKAGGGEFVADHSGMQVQAGDILLLSGGKTGRLRVPPGGELAFWCFSVRLEHLYPLFAGSEISLLQDVVGALKNSKLLPASGPLAVQCHRLIEEVPPQFNLDHRGQLLRVTAAILAEEFNTAKHRRHGFVRSEERVLQVFEALSAEDLLSLSVSELAGKFGCSRRHLNRLFHQNFGLSVAALKMEMRLMRAAACLRDGQAKVIIVAEECGFNHLGLFNTCFKRRFGTSPGRWRRMSLEQPPLLNGNVGIVPLPDGPDDSCALPSTPNPIMKTAQGASVSAAIKEKIIRELKERGPSRACA